MRTQIKQTADTIVTLKAIDPFYGNEVVEWEFNCPRGGGYVRDRNGKQVCAGLSNRGNTLWVDDHEDLIHLIRKQWQELRKEAAKDRAKRRF